MEGITAEGRLNSQIEPERRLLCSANPPGAPSLPVCTMEECNLPIQLSPLWPILSPEGVHVDHASSDSMAEAVGLSDNHLHRRQPSSGIHKGGSQVPSRNIGCTAGSAGISDKLSQVHLGTLLGAPVPGVLYQLSGNDNPGSTDETGGDARAGKKPSKGVNTFRKRDS